VAGKNIKCPACANIFKPAPAAATPTAPSSQPKAITPPPAVKPTAATDDVPEQAFADKEPAPSPSRTIKKRKSNALLYGCLTAFFAVLLLVGLGIAGVFWLINKGKNSLQNWAAAVTSQKTTHISSNVPDNSKGSRADEQKPTNIPPNAPNNSKRPRLNEQPGPGKSPEATLNPAALDREIAAAGAGIKLVKLDLSAAGLPLTMDAPEGAITKESLGDVTVDRGENFALKIAIGRGDMAAEKEGQLGMKSVVDSRDLLFLEGNLFGKSKCKFALNVAAGYRDYFVANQTVVNLEFVNHSRSDCLLMLKCARTLAPKTPPPADVVAALKELKIDAKPDDNGKITFLSMGSNATDSTMPLLKKLPDVEYLELHNARMRDDGLAQLSDRTKLKTLVLSGTRITDNGLRHLSGLINLEKLDLASLSGATRITGAGLAHLAGLHKLHELSLASAHIDDATLAVLKNLTALKSLYLAYTEITDAGLAHLNGLTNLTELYLNEAKIRESGLAGLSSLASLETLDLTATEISDEGLKHLQGLKKLQSLNLARAQKLTDQGLERVGKITSLKSLTLYGIKGVTDAGIVHLKGLTKLKDVDLRATKVTDKGAQELKKALPEAEVKHGSN
jgi:hypothetical protein